MSGSRFLLKNDPSWLSAEGLARVWILYHRESVFPKPAPTDSPYQIVVDHLLSVAEMMFNLCSMSESRTTLQIIQMYLCVFDQLMTRPQARVADDRSYCCPRDALLPLLDVLPRIASQRHDAGKGPVDFQRPPYIGNDGKFAGPQRRWIAPTATHGLVSIIEHVLSAGVAIGILNSDNRLDLDFMSQSPEAVCFYYSDARACLNDFVYLDLDLLAAELLLEMAALTVATNQVPETDALAGEQSTAGLGVALSKVGKAIVLLKEHPDWTNAQIADSVPCNAKYLSQSDSFKAARKAARAINRQTIPRGSKDKDGDVEAFEDCA